jgi:hypothetical protein
MKIISRSLKPELVEFWYRHAKPGRIGLVHLDFPPAKLINWAERFAMPDGKPPPWAHCFLFLRPRNGVLWIAESDVFIPLPGFRIKPDGPQENLIYKWSHPLVDHAIVLDPGMNEDQFSRIENITSVLREAGYTYDITSLLQSGIALVRQDLTYRSAIRPGASMHCGHFLRTCLELAGIDPFGHSVLPENTVPALYPKVFPTVAEWTGPARR